MNVNRRNKYDLIADFLQKINGNIAKQLLQLVFMETENKCPECGAYKGHAPKCSLMSEEYAKSQLKIYYEAWLNIELEHRKSCEMYDKMAQLKLNRIKQERDVWKGKFFTVKIENNSLRKRLLK